MSGPDDADPYFEAIEAAFNRRRGAPLLLSPRDWAMIDGWKRDGVPLRIVLQGIENVFDGFLRRQPGTRRINSLSYCRQEVIGLHEIHLGIHGAAAGRPAGEPAPDPGRALRKYLGRLLKGLQASLTGLSAAGLDGLIGPTAAALATLRRLHRALKTAPADPAAVEKTLADLDAGLLEAARAALPAPERAALDAAAESVLAGAAARMRSEALESTRAAARARLLRQRTGLPRLTLFD